MSNTFLLVARTQPCPFKKKKREIFFQMLKPTHPKQIYFRRQKHITTMIKVQRFLKYIKKTTNSKIIREQLKTLTSSVYFTNLTDQ